MSKELEAFEDLKRQVGNMPYTSYDNGLGNRTTFLIKDSAIFPIIENALKALKIIKEKEVLVPLLIWSDTLVQYNKNDFVIFNKLTKKEFDLLKEVLS